MAICCVVVVLVNLFCLDLDLEADTRSIEAAREALRLKLALADKEPDVLSNTDSDEAEIGPEEIDLEQKITFSGLQRVRHCDRIMIKCCYVKEK